MIRPLGLLLFLSIVAGCRLEMHDQPKFRPLDASRFFPDGASARPLVEGTIPRGHLETNQVFFEGLVGTNLVTAFPLEITRELIERGRERFDIYCSVCHGLSGDGHGMIVQRGFPQPPTFHQPRLREAPIGHFYRVITYGYGVMFPYAARVTSEDRWAIAAYIRTLQLSRSRSLADVPPEARAHLQEDQP